MKLDMLGMPTTFRNSEPHLQGFSRNTAKVRGGDSLQPAGLHALQEAAHTGSANFTIVTTPLQLQDALFADAPHIEIRAHLDLTTIDPYGTVGTMVMLYVWKPTVSIRVRL